MDCWEYRLYNGISWDINRIYHLVMTNIAMENHHQFLSSVKHQFLCAITMAMLVITRG